MSWGTCDKCGHELEMYYNKFCPMCDKPEVEVVKTLNLMRVLYYMEARHSGFKDRFWNWFIEAYDFSNDTTIYFNFNYFDGESDLTAERRLIRLYLYAIKKEFDIKENGIYFEISW